MQELRSKVVEAPAVLEAAATPDKPEEDDLEALMSALGQEAEKVEKLIGLLQERGFDPTDILDEVGAGPFFADISKLTLLCIMTLERGWAGAGKQGCLLKMYKQLLSRVARVIC